MRITGVLALAAAALLAACASGSAAGTARVAVPLSTSSTSPVEPTQIQRVLAQGWADNVVRAGQRAYVEGWDSAYTASLWAVDARGALSLRVAPPGAPGNPALFPGSVYDLAFGDANNGLAITGTPADRRHSGHRAAYVTADGARTWNRIDLPTDAVPADVAVGGGKDYVLASDCATPNSACDHATLWRVDPAAPGSPRSVDNLPVPTPTSGPITLAAYGDSVWVLLDTGAGTGATLHSSNAGRSWQPWETDSCVWEAPTATSAHVLWSTCGTGMLAHFTRQTTTGPSMGVFREVSGTSSSGLYPIDDQTAYAIIDRGGRRATIEVTHDAGRTVRMAGSIPRPIDRRGFRAVLVSPSFGVLVTLSGGQVYRTANHGQTWTKIPAPTHGRHR